MNNSIFRYIDAAILKPEISRNELINAIKKCISFDVFTVCVRPCDIDIAVNMCKGTKTDVSCVLNFPHGLGLFETKTFEAEQYIKKGAKEIDMVVNYSLIKSGLWDLVEQDILSVSKIINNHIQLKVIFETSMLTTEEIIKTTEISIKAKADFVKTSTGFNGEGATVKSVDTMLKTSNGRIKVKASGGIRDLNTAKMFVDMGCSRLGVGYSTVFTLNDENSKSKESY